MTMGCSPGGVTSIRPSIRQTICLSVADLPHKSVPRTPAVTFATLMFTSRFPRSFLKISVVKRNAPSPTSSAAANTPSFCCAMSLNLSLAFSPSFTELPSAVLSSRRELAPVRMSSPFCNSMPGASGSRALPRSTQAGICTASTVALGAAWLNCTIPSARLRPTNTCVKGKNRDLPVILTPLSWLPD